MQVSESNNIKVYNLSSGKSLPEWLSERKRRQLLKKDVDVRRRIELIQGFDMPTASTNVAVSKDGQYVMATGVYKPRIRCYDVSQLSLKFERCFDADVIKFDVLSEDYSKMVFLQSDRYVEFHAQYGRYYRTRMPKFGRDLAYHYPSCDLFLVGGGSDVYRLNLEQGRFLQPFTAPAAHELNVCEVNPEHQLLAVGSNDGKLGCFDPRAKNEIGCLDIGLYGVNQLKTAEVPSVTALKFNDALHYGVGLSTGHVLLYDLRSPKPLLVKDHFYCQPIRSILFHKASGNAVTADEKVIKIWNQETGETFTTIEPNSKINDICLYPDSGLLFGANEGQKMLTFYIPSLGSAPRWCSFLDNLTEELEESKEVLMYDDYKFVTKQELHSLGLQDLVGTNLLRAYMHGFFMDVRLYHKAKSIVDPFAFDEYKKSKIKQKIEGARESRVKLKKLPRINRFLAEKLIDEKKHAKESKMATSQLYENPIADNRFGALFNDPNFQIDQDSEEFQHLHPVLSKQDRSRKKKLAKHSAGQNENDDSSSSDEDIWKEVKEMKRKKKKDAVGKADDPKFYELKVGQEYASQLPSRTSAPTVAKAMSFGQILSEDNKQDTRLCHVSKTSLGNKEIVFVPEKSADVTSRLDRMAEHKRERRSLRRSAGDLTSKKGKTAVFWKGRRVK